MQRCRDHQPCGKTCWKIGQADRTALEYCDENDALIVRELKSWRELERAVMEVPVFTFSNPVGYTRVALTGYFYLLEIWI